MKRHTPAGSIVFWLLVWLLPLLMIPVSGWGETLKVGRADQVLYPDPDFAGTPLCRVPLGGQVERLLSVGDWFKVTFQDCKGWINRSAFPELRPPAGEMTGLLTGGGVKTSGRDEVALGGRARKSGRDEVALGGKAERMPSQGISRIEMLPTLKRNQALYRDPDPSGTPLGSVSAGQEVEVVARAGDWRKIKCGDRVGWLPQEALSLP